MRSVRALSGFSVGLVLTGLLGWFATPGVRDAIKKPAVDHRFVAMTDDWEDLCEGLQDRFGIELNHPPNNQSFEDWYQDWVDDFLTILEENNWVDPIDEAAEWGARILRAYGVQPGDLDDPPHSPSPPN